MAAIFLHISHVSAGQVFIGSTSIHVISYKEKNSNIVKQNEDNSCGASAIATILKYVFNDDKGESNISKYIKNDKYLRRDISAMLSNIDEKLPVDTSVEKKQKDKKIISDILLNLNVHQNFNSDTQLNLFINSLSDTYKNEVSLETQLVTASFLEKPSFRDLIYAIESSGYSVGGKGAVEVKFKDLNEVVMKSKLPVIVQIIKLPLIPEHFTVFRGTCNGYTYLADPSLGNIRIPTPDFIEMWKYKGNSNANQKQEETKGKLISIKQISGRKPDGTPDYDWPTDHSLTLPENCL